jgi:hypothetical protein
MADPQEPTGAGSPREKAGFWRGWQEGWLHHPYESGVSQWQRIAHNSVFNPRNWRSNPDLDYNAAARIGHILGALGKDFTTDGSRVVYWALNHPLAVTSVFAEMAAEAAKLSDDVLRAEYRAKGQKEPGRAQIEEEWAKRMGFFHPENPTGRMPAVLAKQAIPILASTAVVATSGNHDILNLAQGARAPGFKPVFPNYDDPTQTENVPLELAARYIAGRRGRLLPWEEFTQERPEVSPSDYEAYRDLERSRGALGGLAKGTMRNLEGEPEVQLMGFRTPLSSVGTAAGTMLGGIAGSHIGNRRLLLKEPEGVRRVAGALLGGLAGAGAGNVGTRLTNAAVIQPIVAPERQQQQRAWEEQQRAAGNL